MGSDITRSEIPDSTYLALALQEAMAEIGGRSGPKAIAEYRKRFDALAEKDPVDALFSATLDYQQLPVPQWRLRDAIGERIATTFKQALRQDTGGAIAYLFSLSADENRPEKMYQQLQQILQKTIPPELTPPNGCENQRINALRPGADASVLKKPGVVKTHEREIHPAALRLQKADRSIYKPYFT